MESRPVHDALVFCAIAGSALLVAMIIILTIWLKKRCRCCNIPHSSSNSDEEEYADVITLSQEPHTDKVSDHTEQLGRSEDEYEVIPPSLPPRNMSGPLVDNQNVTAAVHGVDNPQAVMDEDGYESVKDDPQSDKYANSQASAASKEAETVVQVVMDPDDYLSFVVTEKDQPQPNKYVNSQDTGPPQRVILYDNENETVKHNDPQSHKYENSDVIAAAKDHYQQLRKETLEQKHTYTSLQTHDQ